MECPAFYIALWEEDRPGGGKLGKTRGREVRPEWGGGGGGREDGEALSFVYKGICLVCYVSTVQVFTRRERNLNRERGIKRERGRKRKREKEREREREREREKEEEGEGAEREREKKDKQRYREHFFYPIPWFSKLKKSKQAKINV